MSLHVCRSRAVRSTDLTRGAGPAVAEDLVDHRRLGDAGDEAHRAVAGRARQRVAASHFVKTHHELTMRVVEGVELAPKVGDADE